MLDRKLARAMNKNITNILYWQAKHWFLCSHFCKNSNFIENRLQFWIDCAYSECYWSGLSSLLHLRSRMQYSPTFLLGTVSSSTFYTSKCVAQGCSGRTEWDENSHYATYWRWRFEQQHSKSIIPPQSDEVKRPDHPWLTAGGSFPPCSQCRCWPHVPPATWLLPHVPHHKLGGW